MSDTAIVALPSRLLMRLQGEFHMCGVAALQRLLPGEYTRAILLMAIVRTCVSDWTHGERPAPPERPGDGASILSIAQSLHCPFETARSNIRRLIADGYCATDGRRVVLAHDGPHRDAITRYIADTHDNLMQLVESVAAIGLLAGPAATPPHHPVRAIARTSLDLALIPFEHQREPFINWTTMLIWGAIGAACVRSITQDPVLNRTYADIASPDALRQPISFRRVAAALSIPPATASRHGRHLATLGLISRAGNGWVIADENLTDDRIADGMMANAAYLMRKVRETVAQGLHPDRLADRYLIGRPAYLAFGLPDI